MSDANINANLTQYERPEHIFPILNATQMASISAHGKKRAVQAGEVLVEPGDITFLSSWSHWGNGNNAAHPRW
jgi:hypothetical protein